VLTSSGEEIMASMKSSPILLKTRAKLTVLAPAETDRHNTMCQQRNMSKMHACSVDHEYADAVDEKLKHKLFLTQTNADLKTFTVLAATKNRVLIV